MYSRARIYELVLAGILGGQSPFVCRIVGTRVECTIGGPREQTLGHFEIERFFIVRSRL